jgi:hypothetical protein
LVTFNINIFYLDISSYIFRNPEKYNISEIFYPCSLTDFLGNTLKWKREDDTEELQLFRERDQYMRELLYPWMPVSAITKPYLFYRLSETIRNTLIWKDTKNSLIRTDDISPYLESMVLKVSDNIVYHFDDKRNLYVIYNWFTHHYMLGNHNTLRIFDLFRVPLEIKTGIRKLVKFNPNIYSEDDLTILFMKLYQQKYLIKVKTREEELYEH